jgi:DNA invertase Pin-like site-specific DNA recombinase
VWTIAFILIGCGLAEHYIRVTIWQIMQTEKRDTTSGSQRTGGTELDTLLEFLRPGDTLVVTHITDWCGA